ncbi:A-macroglobulin complement component, partial [Myxococcota bacterium]|nr:A-macroglobulin complement component [Myxococcota bacterium]
MKHNRRHFMLALVAILALGTVATANQNWSAAISWASTQALGGSDRYLAHINTDKPIYRAGEKVHVRGVLLHALSQKPMGARSVYTRVEIKGPKGSTLSSSQANALDSVASFDWTVPDGAAGGEYKIKMSFPNEGYPPAERKFDVRAYRPPRLKSQIVFVRDGYGPGDEVQASVHSERAEGGIPTNAKVTIVARVDGTKVYSGESRIDEGGNCSARFPLPQKIVRGEGSLAFIIEDGGVVETASKTIPILLQTIDLQFFPEGGDLVSGLENRVYVEGRTPAKKPADFEAIVVDDKNREVTAFSTEHDGRGRFVFTPESGRKYFLRITKPSSITRRFALPVAKDKGAVLTARKDILEARGKAQLAVASNITGKFLLTIKQKDKELVREVFNFKKRGQDRVNKFSNRFLKLPRDAAGVLIATLWNEDGKPVAERLLYRQPKKHIQIKIKADKKRYVPGGKVNLTVQTTDGQGKPTPAVVGVSITDESVLEMIDKREQSPRLPVTVFLESEVKELADAHVYLDKDNPKAPLATDLLLGTQGWRRFAFVDTAKFIRANKDAARRVLSLQISTRKERAKSIKFKSRSARNRNFPQARRGGRPRNVPGMAQVPSMAAPEPRGDIPMMAAEQAPRPQVAEAKPQRVKAQREKEPAPPPAPNKRDIAVRSEMGAALADAEMMEEDEAIFDKQVAPRHSSSSANISWIREYAHKARADRKAGDRRDFTETLYWNAALKTDAKSGKAKISFELSDSVTAFSVRSDAFNANGALGSSTESIESVESFYLEPKMPLQITSGDVVKLPVALVNGMSHALGQISLSATAAKGIRIEGEAKGRKSFKIAADKRVRRILTLNTKGYVGKEALTVKAGSGVYKDKVTRPLDVQPLGFPASFANSGMVEKGRSVFIDVNIPQETVSGSLKADLSIYPTPLGNLTKALERLMQ